MRVELKKIKTAAVVLLLLLLTALWSCSKPVDRPPKDDRNLPGIGMARGLITATDNASPGYAEKD